MTSLPRVTASPERRVKKSHGSWATMTVGENNKEMKTTVVRYKKCREFATEPTRGSANAAGYDLYACIDEKNYETEIDNGTYETPLQFCIEAHDTGIVDTGIAVEIPEGYFGAIFARSGLATKKGLRPANCVGVIDSDYRGEIMVALHNDSDEARFFNNGDRIAQLVILPYLPVEFEETEELSGTERGDGGFGSTGQ